MKEKSQRIWVHPDFKIALEHIAADMNKDVVHATKYLAKDDINQLKLKIRPWKKRTEYGIFTQ